MNIKKDDKVVVLSGKNKGKEGKVLSADPKGGKVIVEGVNVATKHQKPKNQQDQGGIIKTETPIYACKVMVVCPKCGKEARPFEMYGTRDYYGIPFRRVCAKCYERIMTTTGYDGVKYDERDENLDADY